MFEPVLAMTSGQGLALVGLVLGPAFFWSSRYGRRPTDPVSQGMNDVQRWSAIPLFVVGVVGLVLWALGH